MASKPSSSPRKPKKDIRPLIDEMLEWQKKAEASFAKKMGPPTHETLDVTIRY